MTIGSDVLGVLVVLLLIVVVLAAVAGAGWGAVAAYERLRPERIAKDLQADALRTIGQMRAVHDEAVAALLSHRNSEPNGSGKSLPPRRENYQGKSSSTTKAQPIKPHAKEKS